MKRLSLCALYGTLVFLLFIQIGCTATKNSQPGASTSIEYRKGIKTPSRKQQNDLVGPPIPLELDPAFAAANTKSKVREKGGAKTYVPPSYTTRRPEKGVDEYADSEIRNQALQLKKYAIEKGYDTTYAFLVNLQMKSGKKRFFVVNLATMQIENRSLVSHGRGEERFTFDRKFSNDAGSNCSSVGKYKIGKSYTGQFGLAYRLYGLDATNSNAFKRFVVLHAMGCISYEETEFPICQSEGCPAVAPQFLEELKPIIDSRSAPMLMWVYGEEAK